MSESYLSDYRPPPAPLPPLTLEMSRERAVKLLSDGYAYDRLSESEFEWRLGRLSSMGTPAAVDSLVADLLASAPENGSALAASLAPRRHILALMSSSRHTGVWKLPSFLDVSAIMADVKLDLRYASIPARCTISVSAVMANVSVIVPPDMPVHFDVSAFMGSTDNDAVATNAYMPGMPLITVKGHAVMAEVRVKVRELRR